MNKNVLNWTCAKISFAFIWGGSLMGMAKECSQMVAPVGIARWVDYSFLFRPEGKLFLLWAILLLCIFYIWEKGMIITTTAMFFLSLLIITYHESQGIYYRNTLNTVIPGVQALAYWIAYFRKDFDVEKNRWQFTMQVIAAFYLLAGISKLQASGWEWIFSGKYFALQIMKNHSFTYFDAGNASTMAKATAQSAFFLSHNAFLVFLLGSSLLLELFAFLALLGKNWRIGMGILLLLMHLSIYWVMDIVIGGVAFNMVIFFLNPLFLFSNLILFVRQRMQ